MWSIQVDMLLWKMTTFEVCDRPFGALQLQTAILLRPGKILVVDRPIDLLAHDPNPNPNRRRPV